MSFYARRWLERYILYEKFCLALPIVVEAFEVINGTYAEMVAFEIIFTNEWDAESKSEATQFINS